MKPGKASNKDPKITLIRKAMTAATTAHGIGGRPKQVGGPKPVTLAGVPTTVDGEVILGEPQKKRRRELPRRV